MGGGMEYKPNKWLEQWLHYRENQIDYFKFDRKNTRIAIVWGLIVPFLTYKYVVYTFHCQDVHAGRPRREFLGVKGDYE